ncbi:uncharacterized protein [Drosophila bipectinata]|uniref:uncharacterized protein n=1 Tax=Drosophila bipectinata TaxID=42026 RepID=UPI001C896467|nr:uncharacterized protein LOC108133197 [Drosophila bipectinata]XP_017108525.2 uncharacterized protein LOC108133197 [Drosophila bipectinata]
MASMADYMDYLDTAREWAEWLPYLLVAYVVLTLVPKSLVRMKRFADADYEAHRNHYHRCYGPELCCHVLAQEQASGKVKPKARKPVTRVYPKRQQVQAKEELAPPVPAPVKRSNVTKIARMFESGNTRQVSRVAPEIRLPEIRMFGASDDSRDSTPCASRKPSIASQLSAQLQHIEQSMHLWQELEEEPGTKKTTSSHSDWEPMAVPVARRTRGTSATPSTASPLSSSPEAEPSSPVLLRKPPSLCLQTSMEDIFQVIARSAEEPEEPRNLNCLSPVTSIDEILSERRFSRTLSAYSITDLLNEEQSSSVDESVFLNESIC